MTDTFALGAKGSMPGSSSVLRRKRAPDCEHVAVPASTGPQTSTTLRHPRPIIWLVACGLLLMAAMAAGTVMMVLQFRDRALTNSTRELQNIAALLSEHMARELRSVEVTQTSVIDSLLSHATKNAQDFDAHVSSYELHVALKQKIVGLPRVSGLGVLDASGKLINSTRTWPVPPNDLSDRPYFTILKADSSRGMYVSEPVRNRGNEAWTLVLARRLTSPDGKFLGVIVGGIELTLLESYFR